MLRAIKHNKMKGKKEFTAQACTRAVNTLKHPQNINFVPQMALDYYQNA